MSLEIKPMSLEDAKTMIGWRYDGDYSMYDNQADDLDEEARTMLDPDNHYYGIYADGEFVGHAVFHAEARVPGGDYAAEALDVGAGMRPDWTGQGKGADVIAQIIAFGRAHYGASVFRATIARWNVRTQKATMKNGFEITSEFKATNSGKEFVILMRGAHA